VKKITAVFLCALSLLLTVFVVARAADRSRRINLPTSKTLTLPVPGYLARTNSFPAMIALSPTNAMPRCSIRATERRRRARANRSQFSISATISCTIFPDNRLSDDYSTRQSYFIGLAFSSDGEHLYASMGSITDPTARSRRAPQWHRGVQIRSGTSYSRTLYQDCSAGPCRGEGSCVWAADDTRRTALPYPAGFAVLPGAKGDRLLIANNLSDNVVLLDVSSGEIEKSFDLSRSRYVPSAYPYTVIANKAGTKAWVSLWNASTVAELDLRKNEVGAKFDVLGHTDPTAPGTHRRLCC